MSKRKKRMERGKTLLILVLLISALGLSAKSGYFDSILERMEFSHSDRNGTESEMSTADRGPGSPGVKPLWLAVCLQDGQRCGVAYDAIEMETVFQRFSASLGEALGSAGEPAEIRESDFRNALEGEGVFLRLACQHPLSLLADWLGTEMKSEAALAGADLLYLGTNGQTAALYYRAEDGSFYVCDTAVNAAALQSRIGEQAANGAYFAFEADDLTSLEGYTLMLSEMPELMAASASNPLRGTTEISGLFEVLDINAYVARLYTEGDGTQVYIDGDKTLRIAPNGNVQFRQDGRDAQWLSEDSLAAAAELALGMAESSVGQYSGSAELCVSQARVVENGYRLCFDYVLNGVPVALRAGHAAEIQIRDGIATQVELNFRNFTVSEEKASVLPMRYAAAIVAADEGGSLSLIYSDSGDEIICEWVTD